ncbi:MAG: hypothetical protein PHF56_15650 [Desulfuromonadaceae bacterium]|nr:hypothetical protein [Desulfuromonadaceae bacterium]
MANNLTGYAGGNVATPVLTSILSRHAIDYNLDPVTLADNLFNNNILPYAKDNWKYHGVTCNCQDLSQAICAVWTYMKTVSGKKGLPVASSVNCSDTGRAIITSSKPVLGGIALGNIRVEPGGNTDGRCEFANHTVAQIGAKFYDLTYMRITSNKADCIEYVINANELIGQWLIYIVKPPNKKILYVRDSQTLTPGFGDCYHELNGEGWISCQDWKTKTARGGLHTRSLDLQAVDTCLLNLVNNGWSGYTSLVPTVKRWIKNNPKEVEARNIDNCVVKLAGFVGIPNIAGKFMI